MKAMFQRLTKMMAIEQRSISLKLREGRAFSGFKEGIREQIREVENVLTRRKQIQAGKLMTAQSKESIEKNLLKLPKRTSLRKQT